MPLLPLPVTIATEFKLGGNDRRYIATKFSRYYIGEKLGSGGNGEAYAARDNLNDPYRLVFKHMREMSAEAASNEATIMYQLSSSKAGSYFPLILEFIKIENQGFGLVMSRVDGQTLDKLMESGHQHDAQHRKVIAASHSGNA